MKRNEHIVPLSRDHHFGLLCGWKITEGLKRKVPYGRIKNYIQFFWQHHLKEHFEQEEAILFPGGTDELVQKALKEHEAIRQLTDKIGHSDDVTLLAEYAELLKDHIRYEERVLFPYLEEHLSQEELLQIGKRLDEVHQHSEDNYEDEFWT